MEVIIDSEEGNLNGGLQMLLDRWRLQEEKFHAFEESLKEVNNLMMYQQVQENLEESISKISIHETSSISSHIDSDISIHNEIMCSPSISSIISNEQDFDNNLNEETCMEGNINPPILTIDESMEEFEKRIWGGVWKDEAFLNDNIVKDSSLIVLKGVDTSLKNNDIKINNLIDKGINLNLIFKKKYKYHYTNENSNIT